MTEQHQATPEQWAATEKRGRGGGDYALSSCIVELKCRIELLEATLTALEAKVAGVEATKAGVRYAVEQMRSRTGSRQHQDKLDRLIEQDRSDAQQLTLVDRVADAIGAADDEGLTNMTWSNHSRAAIRVVAAAALQMHPGPNLTWERVALWLEREASQ